MRHVRCGSKAQAEGSGNACGPVRARLASADGLGAGVAAAVAEMAGGSVFECCRSMWACATVCGAAAGQREGRQCVRATLGRERKRAAPASARAGVKRARRSDADRSGAATSVPAAIAR